MLGLRQQICNHKGGLTAVIKNASDLSTCLSQAEGQSCSDGPAGMSIDTAAWRL